MTPEEIKKMRQINFKQTNAFAMQNGIILGIFSILTQAAFVAGLSRPFVSYIYIVMLINIPILACFLTAKFRREVAPDFVFSFSRGFSHTLLTVLYAGLWAGVATFIYMAFFDKGHVFDCYQANLMRPEMIQALEASGMNQTIADASGGKTLSDVIDELRTVSPATYAAMIVYFYLLASPLIAVFGGLFNIRRRKS